MSTKLDIEALKLDVVRLMHAFVVLSRQLERLDDSDARHERRIDELVRLVEPLGSPRHGTGS